MKFSAANVRLAIVALTGLLCIAWSSGVWFYESHQFQLRADALIDQEFKRNATEVQGIATDLRRSLKIMHGIPATLALEQDIIEALKQQKLSHESIPQRAARVRFANKLPARMRINQLLASAKNNLSADVMWLLDVNGDCIAASNFDQPDSFVASNYAEREYFSDAMAWKEGYQFAVGKGAHKPSLFFSAPVISNAQVIGVIVVKSDMTQLTQGTDLGNTFLIDGNGVVILAQDKQLEMKALADGAVHGLTPEAQRSFYRREEFETLQIRSWVDTRYPRLKRLESYDDPYVIGTTTLDKERLQILVASPLAAVVALDHELFGIFFLITLAGTAILILCAGGLLYMQQTKATRQTAE